MIVKIQNEREMIDLGKKIASDLTGGDIVLLQGELGTGKTTLTKGIAKGLGIDETITSPTFTLMNIYNINKKTLVKQLVHIDTYRLENEEQLKEIGAEDYINDDQNICIIEWPEQIKDMVTNKKTITINISHLPNNTRQVEILKD